MTVTFVQPARSAHHALFAGDVRVYGLFWLAVGVCMPKPRDTHKHADMAHGKRV